MSFLNEIHKKRLELKPTSTIIRYPDGKCELLHCDGETKKLQHQTNDEIFCGYIIDTKPDKIPICILNDFLYLGSQDCVDLDILMNFHITHILSVGIPAPIQFKTIIIEHLFVPCLDLPDTNIKEILSQTNRFIEKVRKMNDDDNNDGQYKLLVHCNAGVSRSTSVVIGYLMQNDGMSFDLAFNLVKEKRPCCRPNDGFLKQLKNL